MNDWFAKRIAAKVPLDDQMARRSLAIRAAMDAYGCRDEAVRFLNRPAVFLDEIRPIDLAAKDETGLRTVVEMLQSLRAKRR